MFGNKICIKQTLIAFFYTGKPVSSRMLVETSYSDIFYMLYLPDRIVLLAKKEVSDIKVFTIKQSMFLTFFSATQNS